MKFGTKTRQRKYRIVALALSLSLMVQAFFVSTPVAYADSNTFAAGSYIIPMDTTYQNSGMWKAYGLLYNLLDNGVSVSWAINDNKAYNGIDFAATTKNLQTGATVGNFSYTGGPFIVSSVDAAKALPLIQAWWVKYPGLPVVHEATAQFTANIDVVMNRAPRIANELLNAKISMAYYNVAGIPDENGNVWSTTSPGIFDQTRIADGGLFEEGPCSPRLYDIFVTPHNEGYSYSLTDPTNLGTRAYIELDFFTQQGGGWIALCHSILSNEAAIADLYHNGSPAVKALLKAPVPGGMLTYNGLPTRDNVGGTWGVYEPNLPVAQAVPTASAQGLPGGSMQTWNAATAGYYPETERVAGFVTAGGLRYDNIVNGAGHNGSTQGKITFLGGHSYTSSVPYSANAHGPYLRMFFNSLFYNSVGVPKVDLIVTPKKIPQGRPTSVMLEVTNTGGALALVTSDVEIFLPAGLVYQGIESGPEPLTVTGDSTTGTTLSWGNSLGTIEQNESAVKVKVGAAPEAIGDLKFCEYKAKYMDFSGENFAAAQCRSLIVYEGPTPVITKEPAIQTGYSGSTVTWTLDYSNPGAQTIYNAVVEDILPLGFGFSAANPAESGAPVVLPDGTTRVRWNVGTLAGGASGTITLDAFAPPITSPTDFTNHVTLTGLDDNNVEYEVADSALVTVIPPPVELNKTVSPTGPMDITATGEVLTYTLRPKFLGDDLLKDVLISDAIPQYTNYVTGSANAGGSHSFTPLPKVDGVDTDTFPGRSTTVSVTASPTVVAKDGVVTATMVITNNSNTTISNIIPSLSEEFGALGATISAPSVSGFTLANGASRTVTFTGQMLTIGSRKLLGSAIGTANGEDYSFEDASSNTILVTNGLNATPAADVVTWRLGSNTPAVDGTTLISGDPAGIYSFYGNGTTNFYRYDLSGNSWASKAVALGNVKEGGALVYDGGGYKNGYLYALRGAGTTAFWRYDMDLNTWTARANTPVAVKNGGSLVYLNGYVYAVGGNKTKNFWRYDPAANTWTATGVMANTPENIGDGGAMTTDGTYIYAFRGDKKADFWRYNPATNTWALMTSAPSNVAMGGALVHLNGYIYAFRGDKKAVFWRYDIAANTWSSMKVAPATVQAGGALTTDGSYIYATQGNGKNLFWRYNPATDTWLAMSPASATVGYGGALAYVPAEALQNRQTSMAINHSLVTTGDQVTVTMTIKSSLPVTNVLPGAPTITATNGASATLVGGPSLMSTDNNISNIGDPVVYQWTYTVTAGANPGSVAFSTAATGSPAITFPTAKSQSVLVSPVLTFQARILGSAVLPKAATRIVNSAMFTDKEALGYGVESNTTINPLKRPILTIVKTNAPDENIIMRPGDEITYTLVLTNEGIGPAQNIVISDAVPIYTSFVTGSVTVLDSPQDPLRSLQVTEPSGSNPLQVSIGYLGPDESVKVTFRVVIGTPAAQGDYQTSNFATVAASGVTTFTSNTVLNNFAYYLNPSFEVTKDAGTYLAQAIGEVIDYIVTLTNTGDLPLSGVTVVDPLITTMAYDYGDTNNDGLLDTNEVWVYTGTYTVKETDVDKNGEGIIYNTVTADTDQTDEQTAEVEVEIKLEKTRFAVTKTVNVPPGSGYGPADVNAVFKIRIREINGQYITDLLLKSGETVELDVPSGTYEIIETAIPFEYKKTGAHVIIFAAGAPGTAFNIGANNLVDVEASRVEVEFTNTFEHITYFHASDNLTNRFSSPQP